MKILKFLLATIVVLALITIAVLYLWPSFGGTVSGERLERAKASSHNVEGKFVNRVPQSPTNPSELWSMFKRQINGDEQRIPPKPIPVVPISKDTISPPATDKLKAIWLGHAGAWLEIDGIRVLIDPVLSDYASPFQGVGPKRFHPSPIALKDLPAIDAVLISHDHYDHLDMATTKHLASKGTQFYVPLGAGAHLERWGVPKDQITDLEWGQATDVKGVKILSTEARHYSGRGILNHKETFWTSWTLVGPKHRAFFSGDTGYSDHFKRIGEAYGPFDLSIIKIGAYGPSNAWIDVHMSAENAVKAHGDLGAKAMLPVHWATFNLAFHDWDEPIKRTLAAAQDATVVTPKVGEVVDLDGNLEFENWWEAVSK